MEQFHRSADGPRVRRRMRFAKERDVGAARFAVSLLPSSHELFESRSHWERQPHAKYLAKMKSVAIAGGPLSGVVRLLLAMGVLLAMSPVGAEGKLCCDSECKSE